MSSEQDGWPRTGLPHDGQINPARSLGGASLGCTGRCTSSTNGSVTSSSGPPSCKPTASVDGGPKGHEQQSPNGYRPPVRGYSTPFRTPPTYDKYVGRRRWPRPYTNGPAEENM
jgi:hypothetical protein